MMPWARRDGGTEVWAAAADVLGDWGSAFWRADLEMGRERSWRGYDFKVFEMWVCFGLAGAWGMGNLEWDGSGMGE